jgi:predicted dinucleotide-binding enzyme
LETGPSGEQDGDPLVPILDAAKLTSSELVQQHLRGAKIVKALHNQDAQHWFINARPHDNANGTTLPIAGDDSEAKEAVMKFMDNIGYNAIDTGSLSDSCELSQARQSKYGLMVRKFLIEMGLRFASISVECDKGSALHRLNGMTVTHWTDFRVFPLGGT